MQKLRTATIVAMTSLALVGTSLTAHANPAPETDATDQSTDVAQAEGQVIPLDQETIDAANALAAERGEPPLSPAIQSVLVTPEGNYVPADADGNPLMMTRSFWGNAWQVTKCAAHLTLVIVPGTAAFRAVRALGGITETARLLVGAGTAAEFSAIAGGLAAEIIGIDGVARECFR